MKFQILLLSSKPDLLLVVLGLAVAYYSMLVVCLPTAKNIPRIAIGG
jgi:hypothetical protein